jgi:hypothetical protein
MYRLIDFDNGGKLPMTLTKDKLLIGYPEQEMKITRKKSEKH